MMKHPYKFCVLVLWALFLAFPLSVQAKGNKNSDARPCSAEELAKIEQDLDKAAEDGLKNAKTLLDNYNKIVKQYITNCNSNLKTGTPVYWSYDTIAAANSKSQETAIALINDPSAYQYTGVVWSAETPQSKECSALAQQANAALQNFNKSRITTSALLGRAGGYKVPRTCICSENADNKECVSFTTQSSEPKKAKDGCKLFTEYLAELSSCPLCPIFEVILNTDSKIAHIAWINLAKPLCGVVIAFFLAFIAIETLKLVASMGGASTKSYLKTLLTLGLKVAIVLIMLQNSTYVYGYFISPVIKGGIEMGEEFVRMGKNDSETATCKLNDSTMTFGSIEGNELDSSILSNIYETVRCFNNSALQLPAIGKSLMCHGWENNSNWNPDLGMWIAGAINYVFGLMIWLSVAFYLVDCTVQLGMICALVPMFIACWPFKMTQRYTFTGIKIIMNTFFNFVLMGIVIMLGVELVNFALYAGNNNIEPAALISDLNNIDINAEKLKKLVNLDSATLLCLVVCCIISMKLIQITNSAASKFSSGAGSSIGGKMGGMAYSAGTKLATGVGGAGLHLAGATAKRVGKKIANTDAGRWVSKKYRNTRDSLLGRPERLTGSGLPEEDENTPIDTPESSRSQNPDTHNDVDTPETDQRNHKTTQPTDDKEDSVYNNGQPKFTETVDENGNTNRKNFDENGNVTSETKTDKNGNEVEYKAYHKNGELATHHTVDENGTRHWQTFNEDKTLSTEGSYNEKTGDRTEKKYDNGKLVQKTVEKGNGDFQTTNYHANGNIAYEGKGNIHTGGHHTSYDENQNITRKWHTFGEGQTNE